MVLTHQTTSQVLLFFQFSNPVAKEILERRMLQEELDFKSHVPQELEDYVSSREDCGALEVSGWHPDREL